jgi:hypothetical protein
VTSGAGLGPLTALEVEGLHLGQRVPRPAEAGRCQLVEVPTRLGLFLGQHAALAGADRGADQLGSSGQSGLRFLRQRAEPHIRHEDQDVEPQRLVGVGTDAHPGGYVDVVEQRQPGQLGGDELDVIPCRQLLAGHAHGRHRPVVAGLGQPVRRRLVDVADERLLDDHVRVADVALIDVGIERLRVSHEVVGDLDGVDVAAVVVDPAGELLELLEVVVGADTAVDPVVPPVQSADQVIALDMAVGQQGNPMHAPAVEHRQVVALPHQHEVNALDHRPDGHSIRHLAPGRDSRRSSFAHHARFVHLGTVLPDHGALQIPNLAAKSRPLCKKARPGVLRHTRLRLGWMVAVEWGG